MSESRHQHLPSTLDISTSYGLPNGGVSSAYGELWMQYVQAEKSGTAQSTGRPCSSAVPPENNTPGVAR